jgi:hypothetical protein
MRAARSCQGIVPSKKLLASEGHLNVGSTPLLCKAFVALFVILDLVDAVTVWCRNLINALAQVYWQYTANAVSQLPMLNIASV